MAEGGKKDALSDTKSEAGATILLGGVVAFIVMILLMVYNPDWYGIGDWFREFWFIPTIGLFMVVMMYRAFQGVSLFPRLRTLSVRAGDKSLGGGGGGGGGGDSGIGIGGWIGILKVAAILLLAFAIFYGFVWLADYLTNWGWAESVVKSKVWPWEWW